MARRPVDAPYTVTTEFGEKDSNALYGLHSGYDYAVQVGTPVRATTSGRIISTINHATRGQMVTLFDGRYYHRFMHNSRFNVSPGQDVSEGDIIAYSGGALNAFGSGLSTGPHCHWDMNTRGVDTNAWSDFVDPDDWLKGRIPQADAPIPAAATQALEPWQRVVHPTDTVNYREAPNTSAAVIKEFPAKDVLDFKGWVYGEAVGGNNVWFVGRYTGGYCWSGAFTDTSTNGLDDLNVSTVPNDTSLPTAPVVTTPVSQTPDDTSSKPDVYSFTKDLSCVTDVRPAGIGSFQYGNFPAMPSKIVVHDFGTRGVDTLQSVINYFQKPDNISAHFAVQGKQIIQFVKLSDRAYHAGPNGNNFIGIETSPYQDADTIASTKLLLMQLEQFYGYQFTLIKHSSIMPTKCGDDIDLASYDIHGGTTLPTITLESLDMRITKLESDKILVIDFIKSLQ